MASKVMIDGTEYEINSGGGDIPVIEAGNTFSKSIDIGAYSQSGVTSAYLTLQRGAFVSTMDGTLKVSVNLSERVDYSVKWICHGIRITTDGTNGISLGKQPYGTRFSWNIAGTYDYTFGTGGATFTGEYTIPIAKDTPYYVDLYIDIQDPNGRSSVYTIDAGGAITLSWDGGTEDALVTMNATDIHFTTGA